jgi:hypothetical protein
MKRRNHKDVQAFRLALLKVATLTGDEERFLAAIKQERDGSVFFPFYSHSVWGTVDLEKLHLQGVVRVTAIKGDYSGVMVKLA